MEPSQRRRMPPVALSMKRRSSCGDQDLQADGGEEDGGEQRHPRPLGAGKWRAIARRRAEVRPRSLPESPQHRGP